MTDKENLYLGEKFYIIRRRAGLSQTELGEKAGISRNTIWAIERGDQSVKMSTLIAVAEALGFSLFIQLMELNKAEE